MEILVIVVSILVAFNGAAFLWGFTSRDSVDLLNGRGVSVGQHPPKETACESQRRYTYVSPHQCVWSHWQLPFCYTEQFCIHVRKERI